MTRFSPYRCPDATPPTHRRLSPRRRLVLVLTLAVWLALGPLGCRREVADAPPSSAVPVRIVSQTILSDEVLWRLGDGVRGRVIAVSRMADDDKYSGVAGRWPDSVDRTPLTGESLLAAEPDLVIIAEFTAVETRELLQRAGLRTLTLSGFSGFADFRTNAAAIGEAVGAKQAGEAIAVEFDAELARRRAETVGPDATVVSWAAGNVAGAGTTFDDVATAAGLRNIARTRGIDGHKPVAIEQLVVWDPRWLVVPCEQPADAGDACDAVAATVAAQPGIEATRAGRNGGVIAVPSRILYSSGWEMLDAVSRLRAAVTKVPPA